MKNVSTDTHKNTLSFYILIVVSKFKAKLSLSMHWATIEVKEYQDHKDVQMGDFKGEI